MNIVVLIGSIILIALSIFTWKLNKVARLRTLLIQEEREWIFGHVDMVIERLIRIGVVTSKEDFLDPRRWQNLLSTYFYLRDKELYKYYGNYMGLPNVWKSVPMLGRLMDYYSVENLERLFNNNKKPTEVQCI